MRASSQAQDLDSRVFIYVKEFYHKTNASSASDWRMTAGVPGRRLTKLFFNPSGHLAEGFGQFVGMPSTGLGHVWTSTTAAANDFGRIAHQIAGVDTLFDSRRLWRRPPALAFR